MRRLTHLLVLAAFVFSCGGQWYVLQGIAWVKMIHDYSQMVSFTEAVGMTFSGEYPCAICKAIDEKKQSEQDKINLVEKYDKKIFEPISTVAPQPSFTTISWSVRSPVFVTRTEPPPTPPPQILA